MAKGTFKTSSSVRTTTSKFSKVKTDVKAKEAKAAKSAKIKPKTFGFGKTGLTGRT